MAAKQNDPQLGSKSPARPGDPIDLGESVAGEEDPGASFDMPAAPRARGDTPPAQAGARPPVMQQPMAPGDQAPAGTPSTGENLCPECGGSGRLGAARCANCEGTGKVIVGIGGA